MCDDTTFENFRKLTGRLTRREFAQWSAGTGAALMLPRAVDAVEVTSVDIDVETDDGVADCHFAHPRAGTHPGIVVWPDARGIRPTYRQIAERLAESGYAVLVVNPYYRGHRGPVLPDGTDPRQGNTMEILRPLLAGLSPETEATDVRAAIRFLDSHPAVAGDRPMGTLGFCLGGPATFRTAALFPERVSAGASFHGVRLVTDEPTSPHRLIASMRAQFAVAIAEDDNTNDPDAARVLRESFDAAGLFADIEVYEGALHSWTTPDSPVHNPEQAERAWRRMLTVFSGALA